MHTRFCSRAVVRLVAVGAASFAIGSLAPSSARAGVIAQYSFPASWAGTGTLVTDQSPAGNNARTRGTPALTTDVPAGAPAGTESMTTNIGNFHTLNNSLLTNAAVAAGGGFTYETWFKWDGTATTFNTQKIIDYAGTESLQLFNPNGASQTAGELLQFAFDSQTTTNVVNSSLALQPNTWYHVLATFDSGTNAVDGSGNLAGTGTISVDTGGAPIVDSGPLTKTAQGDTLARPIGFGRLGGAFTSGTLVAFNGNIYNPAVTLLPEPTTLGVASLGMIALAGARRRRR